MDSHVELTGFTEKELSEAFDRVASPDDWKAKIQTEVTVKNGKELSCIRRAIGFYTATEATIIPLGGNKYLVNSKGYRAGPAGP